MTTETTSVSQTMSPEIASLAAALSKAQGEIKAALKDSSNPYYGSKYADLASIWSVAREPLSKNQLAVIQTTEGECSLITTLVHSSGQWIRGSLKMNPVKSDPQGVGSAITYARRYALAAMVGIASEDDDAESAMNRNQKAGSQRTTSGSQSVQNVPTPDESVKKFIDLNKELSEREGPDAYKNFIKNAKGESPTVERIKNFSTPVQLTRLKQANDLIQEHLKKLPHIEAGDA